LIVRANAVLSACWPFERLMGNEAELRFEFIQERAEFAADDLLDV
jgi:hypothetical protein